MGRDEEHDDDARSAETELVAGLVSAVRSRVGGHLSQEEIDAALGVTHQGEAAGTDSDD